MISLILKRYAKISPAGNSSVGNVLAVQVCGLELDHQILHSRNVRCGVLTPEIPELSPRGLLASRASLLGQLQVSGETLSQENKVNGI